MRLIIKSLTAGSSRHLLQGVTVERSCRRIFHREECTARPPHGVDLLLLGVATTDHLPPSHPIPCILFPHTAKPNSIFESKVFAASFTKQKTVCNQSTKTSVRPQCTAEQQGLNLQLCETRPVTSLH